MRNSEVFEQVGFPPTAKELYAVSQVILVLLRF
jgi:hypothetical protein